MNAALAVLAVLVAAAAVRVLIQTLPPLRRAAGARTGARRGAAATASGWTAW